MGRWESFQCFVAASAMFIGHGILITKYLILFPNWQKVFMSLRGIRDEGCALGGQAGLCLVGLMIH